MTQFKNVKGFKELQKMLDTLPPRMEANIMRSALRSGAKVIMDEARANVPVADGDLRDSLRVSTRLRKGVVTATVKAGNRKAWYWRFVEFGTAAHTVSGKKGGFLSFGGIFKRSVHHPGAKAKPFMRPALDSKADAALKAVGQQIKRRLTRQGLNAADIEVEVDAE